MRRTTSSLCALALAFGLFGCAGDAPKPLPVELSTAQEVVVSSQPPAPMTSAQVAAPAPSDAVVRAQVDMTAAFARLPKDAAVYALFRPVAADTLVEWTRTPERFREEFRRLVPSGTFLELLRKLTIDPNVPIALAVVGPDVAEAKKLVESVLAAKSTAGDPTKNLFAQRPPLGVFARLVIHPAKGGDLLSELEGLAGAARLKAARCPGGALCDQFTGEKPIAVMTDSRWTAAIYRQGSELEIDFFQSRITNGEGEWRAQALASRRSIAVGGPSGRCSQIDSTADLSMCVDATRAGDLGAGLGLLMTLSAVQGGMIDPTLRSKVVAQGRKESLINLELAKPARQLADDGTLSITVARAGFKAVGSWQLTQASAPAVGKAFDKERCFDHAGVTAELFPALIKAFGDPGRDFSNVDASLMRFREAGFSSALVSFGRIWPNMLKATEMKAFTLGKLGISRACARVAADRLEVLVEGPPLSVDRL